MTRNPLHHRFLDRTGRTPVLYLHGFMGCCDDWQPVVERMGGSVSILLVDLPGHGKSYHADTDDPSVYSMHGCSLQLLRLLDAFNIRRCHVMGYSMGGRLALYLAVNHPDRFDRFVIESGSPGLKTEAERSERRRRDKDLANSLRLQNYDDFLAFWYNQPLFATMDQSSAAFEAMMKRRRRNHTAGLAISLEQMGTGAQPPLWDELPKIKAPILFIAGEKDHKFNQMAAHMAHLCPNGRLAILASAGHNVHFEQLDAFTRQARDFLSEG